MGWFQEVLNAKTYEPDMRNKDGFQHVCHRFPIKNGISLRDVLMRQVNRQPSQLGKLFAKVRPFIGG